MEKFVETPQILFALQERNPFEATHMPLQARFAS